jgi:hypothetical protein
MHAVLLESRRYRNPAHAHVPGTNTVYGHIDTLNLPTPPDHHRPVVTVGLAAPGGTRLLAWLLGGALVCLAALVGWWWRGPHAQAAIEPMPLPASRPPQTAAPASTTTAVAWPPPAWASHHGEDAGGRWAEVTVGTATQRLRFCPPGTFLMGSAPAEAGHRDDEKPVRVTLRHGFWLGDTPVAQRLYEAVVGRNPSAFRAPELPVESISWDDAQAFLQHINALLPSASLRLPTEAEWEYAARAGGAGVPAVAGGSAPGARTQTHAVGSSPANAWGLHDMLGNVLEWCQDFYMPYPAEAADDPIGWQGINRVARGGAWSMADADLRLAARTKYLPVTRFFFLGLRIAATEP